MHWFSVLVGLLSYGGLAALFQLGVRYKSRHPRYSVVWRKWPDQDMTREEARAYAQHPRFHDLPGAHNGAVVKYLTGAHSSQRMEELLDERFGLKPPPAPPPPPPPPVKRGRRRYTPQPIERSDWGLPFEERRKRPSPL